MGYSCLALPTLFLASSADPAVGLERNDCHARAEVPATAWARLRAREGRAAWEIGVRRAKLLVRVARTSLDARADSNIGVGVRISAKRSRTERLSASSWLEARAGAIHPTTGATRARRAPRALSATHSRVVLHNTVLSTRLMFYMH